MENCLNLVDRCYDRVVTYPIIEFIDDINRTWLIKIRFVILFAKAWDVFDVTAGCFWRDSFNVFDP